MAKALRTAALVVGAVALVATGVGALAGAGLFGAGAMGAAGTVAGVSTATIAAVGTYASLAAAVLSVGAAATAPGVSVQGSATTFTTNPQSGLPYAMGRTRMSGLRFFAATNSRPGYTKFHDLLWFGALLSIGGAIDSIESFTADGVTVNFDASGNAVGTYHDYMGQRLHMGGQQSAAVSLSLGGGTAPGWTAQHKLSGVTHAMWCLRFNKEGELYGAGAPEPAWIGKWTKVYDPRLDSTYPGGSGTCRALEESTYVWSDNPGLHALTWALGRWQNGKRTCGIGAPIAHIRVAEFVECANICEANGWKVGGVEWTTDTKWATLKRILQAGGARPTKSRGMIGCLVSAPRAAIATIQSRHLLDKLQLNVTKTRRERFNSVIPRYIDEDSDWAVISGTAISVPDYVTADRGARTKEIDYPLVQVFAGQEATQPGQLAAYDIVNSREAGPFTWSTGPEWIGVKTGDVVNLNVPEEGLVNQPILITKATPDPATGKINFAGETETHSKHAFALGQSTTPPSPFTLTAPDLKPPAPEAANWAVSGTTTGEGLPALVVVGESEHPSADALLIDYRKGDGDVWTGAAILSAQTAVRHVIAPLESETAYQVRIGYRVGQIDGSFTILAAVTGTGIISDISDTIDGQQDQLAQLEADTAAAASAIAAAQAQIAAIESSVSADFTAINADVAALQSEVSAAQGDIGSLQSASSAVQQSVATLQGDLSVAQQAIATIESDVSLAQSSIGSLENSVAALSQQAATIEQSVGDVGAQLGAAVGRISAAEGEIDSLQTLTATHGSLISQNASAISNAVGDLAALSSRVSAGRVNLLEFGSFELGAIGWPVRNGNWSFDYNFDWGSIALLASPANGIYVLQSEPFPVTPGNSYTIAGDTVLYADQGAVYVDLIYRDGAGAQLLDGGETPRGPGHNFSNDTNARGLVAHTSTAPSGATQAVARFVATGLVNCLFAGVRQIKVENGVSWSAYTNEATIINRAVALQSAEGQIASLTTRIGTAESSIAIQASAITNAQGSIALLETNVGSLNGWVATVQQSVTDLSGTVSSLSSTVSAQGASITSLQTASSSLSGEISQLQTQVTAGGGNLLVNTDFAIDASGWVLDGNQGATGGLNLAGPDWKPATENVLTIVQANATASGQTDWTQTLALEGGKWLDVSVGAASHRANIQIYLQCIDAAGNVLETGTTGAIGPAGGGNTLASFPVRSFKMLAPAGTVSGKLFLRKFGTLSGGDSYAWFIRPQVAETTASRVGSVPYSPGSARASIATQANAISTLNGQYASLASTVATQGASITQQASAISTLQGDQASLASRVGTAESSISSNALAISTAQGALASLTTRVGTAENAVQTNAQAISTANGDIASLSTTVSGQGGQISSLQSVQQSHAGTIAQHSTAIATANSNISSNAQALSTMSSSYAALESRVSSAEGNVSSLQSSMTSANGSISTLQSNVSSLNGSVSSLQQSSTTQAGQISALQSTVATQGASIGTNALAITSLQGNVATLSTIVTASSNPNLLPNGGFENQLSGWTGEGAAAGTWFTAINSWGNYAANTSAWAGGANVYAVLRGATVNGLDAGSLVTLTADADISATSAGASAYVQIAWYSDNGVTYSSGPARAVNNAIGFDTSGASRSAFALTATVPSGATGMAARLVVGAPQGVTITSMCWRQVKLERGGVATPYSGEATAGQIYTAYTTLGSSFASLSSTVSSQGGSINTLQSSYTSLNGTVSSLSSTVSAQGASITSLQTASSSLSGEISQLQTQVTAGGGNLLVNTDFAIDASGWVLDGNQGATGGLNLAGPDWKPATENVLTIVQANATASGQTDWTQTLALEGGKWLDVSVGAASHRANIQIYLQCIDAAGNVLETGTTGAIGPAGGGNTLASFPVRSFKMLAPAGTVSGKLFLRKFGTLSGGDSYAWFIRPQVAETTASRVGSVPYSPGSARASIATQANAISTLNGQYASLASTVATQGASITQQASAISTLQGDQASLASTVGTHGSQISSLQTATSTTAGDVATLTTRVNAGAPNILKEGSFANGLGGWATSGGAWGVTGGDDPYWGRYVSVSGSVNSYAATTPQAAMAGQSYTISADIDRGGASGGLVAARIVWTSNGAYHSLGPTASKASGGFSNSEADRVWATGVCPSGANGFYVQLVVEGAPSGANAFRRIKINTGTSPARYSEEASIVQSFEALSTLTTQYASLSSTVAAQGVSISSQATAISAIEGNVTSLFARAAVTISAGNVITGWENSTNGSVSSFKIQADIFEVVPSNPSGERTSFNNGAWKGYDSAGQKRFQLGNLAA
ncbi:MAG: hypothetical protein U9R77_14125 [Pseudomonadota bacterium]|nr:hypothetical protein [Pseudomonadota bacterium]